MVAVPSPPPHDAGPVTDGSTSHGASDTADTGPSGSRRATRAPSGQPLPPGHPERIGPYRIVSLLGMGGMGAVYEGEQENPRRMVALKVLRVALAHGDLRRRFALEGQVLGRLRHPAVAQVYAMGTDILGAGVEVPYLAMELISGARTFDRFVAAGGLSLEERLELFCQVVDGVEHAHQQGIVHRDLKPANVMVDIEGRPKVIDFGLARIVGDEDDLASMHTATGQIMGTYRYMSPEQFEGRPGAVGLATDVFALGVMLYELVSGKAPLDLDGLSVADMARTVREPPPRRLSDSTGTRVHDDLDTIVGKAMEKQPERRYETAAALAADVRRYLRQEPILARRASVLYQARLFARRHRLLVTSAAAVLLVSVVAAIVSVRFALDARRRADETERSAYRARIQGAAGAVREGRLASAAELLADTPPALRGWEYRHLHSRLARSLPPPWTPDVRLVFFSPGNGAGLATATRMHPDGTSDWAVLELVSGDVRLAVPRDPAGMSGLEPGGPTFFVVDPAGQGLRRLRTWDVATGRLLLDHELPFDEGRPLRDVRIRPGGDRILLRSSEGMVVLDAGTGRRLASTDATPVLVDFLPDGSALLCVTRPGGAHAAWSLELLDAETLAPRPGGLPLPDVVAPMGLSCRGDTVALVDDAGRLHLLRITGDGLSRLASSGLSGTPGGGVAWSADARRVATSTYEGDLSVFDTASGALVDSFHSTYGQIDQAFIQGYAFLPDTGDLLSLDTAGELTAWPVGVGTPEVLQGHRSFVYPVALSDDGGLLLSGGWDGWVGQPGNLKLWDAATSTRVAEHGRAEGGVRVVAASLLGDGREAVVSVESDAGRRFELLDLLGGRSTEPDGGAGEVVLAVSPDGRLVVSQGPQTARVWERDTGATVRAFPDDPDAAAFSPDGTLLALCDGRVGVRLLATDGFAERLRWTAHEGRITQLAFAPDGRWLLSASVDGTVGVWETATAALVARLDAFRSEVLCVAMSPDGTRIATGGRDTYVRLWDTTWFENVASLGGHERYVHSLAWSPDGERLVSGSGDGTVRLWDTRTLPEQIAARRAREAALPAIEAQVARTMNLADDPRAAVAALLDGGTLSPRERQLALQAAIGFALPEADAARLGAARGTASADDGGPPRGPAWYRAPRVATPPVIDGVLDDAAWADAPWTTPFVDIEGPVRPRPPWETRAKITWDDESLYVAARLEEPHLWATLTEHDAVVYRDDDFELFVDPDGDRRHYGEVEVNALGTVFDLTLTRGYREGGRPDIDWSPPGLRAAVALDGTLNDPTDEDRGWTVEIALPHAALSEPGHAARLPRPGDTWRLNFSRVQWTLDVLDGRYGKRPDTPEHNWVWTPQYAIDMHRPEHWGFVEFTGGDG